MENIINDINNKITFTKTITLTQSINLQTINNINQFQNQYT